MYVSGRRIIVSTLIAALPSVMYISILIFLMLYIYAVLGAASPKIAENGRSLLSCRCMSGVFIFGENDKKYFGNLGKATSSSLLSPRPLPLTAPRRRG